GELKRNAARAQQPVARSGEDPATHAPVNARIPQKTKTSRPPTSAGKWERRNGCRVPSRPKAARWPGMYWAASRPWGGPTPRGGGGVAQVLGVVQGTFRVERGGVTQGAGLTGKINGMDSDVRCRSMGGASWAACARF